MNFFESQHHARHHTARLVFLFALAVVTLIGMTNLLVMLAFGYLNSRQLQGGGALLQQMDWQTFALVSLGVGAIVLFGSLYKIMALSAGGKVVAESLGGQLIAQNTDDLNQRKLLNVVEEMAIASGTPPPPVYLLADEKGINAFAAGFSPRDAVIGVTRGTVEHLNRDQLQGVIAHEFSHIFNGDMRLNIRLMGVLNGILILGIIGYYILRSTAYSRRSRNSGKGAGGILVLGLGLTVIGFAGTFFGGLIKAAVSRQREYLADASAVQFTRNPDGIAGALKRIGGLESGSIIENPGAPEVSHAFFAQGISGFMQSLSATHPPLNKRILRIDPQWDGNFLVSDSRDKPVSQSEKPKAGQPEPMSREAVAQKVAAVVTGAAMADVAKAIDQIGNPGRETADYARSLIAELSTVVKDAAREPYGARAVMYAMVLNREEDVRARQLKRLQENADPEVFALTLELMPKVDGLEMTSRLPIINLAVPSLKQLSLDQYKVFKANMIALIEADERIELLEWTLQKILFNHLEAHFYKLRPAKARYAGLEQLKKEVGLTLSVMACAGHENRDNAREAFNAAIKTLDINGVEFVEKDPGGLSDLDVALQKLAKLKPLIKPRLLKACAASVTHDNKISPVEVEVLRAISDVLDCPMPPIVRHEPGS